MSSRAGRDSRASLMTAVSSSTTAPSKAPSVYYPEPEKCALRRLRRRRRALRRHRFADRNLQAERRRSARLSCYVDGHDVELWEGTRQVALLTRSNRLLNSGGFLLLRARRRRAVCLGTINGRGGYLHVPGPRRHLCV